jgi:MFS family permease
VSDPARAVAVWLAGVMALAVLALQAVPVLAPAIGGAAGLAPGFVGAFNAGVWAAALVATGVAPWLLAQVPAWRLTQACLLLCAAGLACVAGGHAVWLVLAALCIGLAQGLEGPVSSHLLAAHVPPPRRPWLFSVKQSGVQLGALAASLTLPAVAAAAGWRAAVLLAAACVAASALLLRRPAGQHAVALATPARGGMLAALCLLRRAPVLRALALAAAAFGAMQVVLNGFFVSYAVHEHGASLVQAGGWLGLAQAGGLVGRLAWGWTAGRLAASMPVLLGLGVVMSLCALLLGLWGPQWLLLCAFGLSASGWNGIFLAEVSRHVPASQAGLATAAVLLVMTLGLVGGPLLFAAIGSVASLAVAYCAWSGVGMLGVLALLVAMRARQGMVSRS